MYNTCMYVCNIYVCVSIIVKVNKHPIFRYDLKANEWLGARNVCQILKYCRITLHIASNITDGRYTRVGIK